MYYNNSYIVIGGEINLKLHEKITEALISEKIIDISDRDIYNYCFEYIRDQLSYSFFIIVFALILHNIISGIIIVLFSVPIRCFGGGIHMPSRMACQITTLLCDILLLTLPAKLNTDYSFLMLFIVILLLSIIYFVGPVIPPEKNIACEQLILMRRNLNITLIILLFTSIIIFVCMDNTYCITVLFTMTLMTFLIVLGKLRSIATFWINHKKIDKSQNNI